MKFDFQIVKEVCEELNIKVRQRDHEKDSQLNSTCFTDVHKEIKNMEAPKLTEAETRLAILNKVRTAFDLWIDTLKANENSKIETKLMQTSLIRSATKTDCVKFKNYYDNIVKIDSYKMLVTNYLCCLFGNRKNDKISYLKSGTDIQINKVKQFIDANKENYHNLLKCEIRYMLTRIWITIYRTFLPYLLKIVSIFFCNLKKKLKYVLIFG